MVLSGGLGFVRHDDGLYLYACHGYPYAHSLAIRPSARARFDEVSLGEEDGIARAGLTIGRLPPWHAIYSRRSGEHAYPARRAMFLRVHGPARFIGDVPDSFVDSPCNLAYFPTVTGTDEEMFRSLGRAGEAQLG
jgi:hypothetical protein